MSEYFTAKDLADGWAQVAAGTHRWRYKNCMEPQLHGPDLQSIKNNWTLVEPPKIVDLSGFPFLLEENGKPDRNVFYPASIVAVPDGAFVFKVSTVAGFDVWRFTGETKPGYRWADEEE